MRTSGVFIGRSQGDFRQTIQYHEQDLAIAKEMGDLMAQGREGRTETSGTRTGAWGNFPSLSSSKVQKSTTSSS